MLYSFCCCCFCFFILFLGCFLFLHLLFLLLSVIIMFSDEFGLSISNHVDSVTLPHLQQKDLWSAKTDLAELFSKLGLGKYTDVFQQQEVEHLFHLL